ncbi:MAG: diacylglycerol kinase family lipid kinase [Chitinophagaceae bacterium]|nr:MAG: diacylglycerol kinase family lipid kinase [Chitinophagaceae bacterium]
MVDAWFFIINPVSGGGKGIKKWPKLKRVLINNNIEFKEFFTIGNGDATKLAIECISNGAEKICVVGGDGTLNEVVNGVLQQKHKPSEEILISMFAVGTGNDWVKTMKIPTNTKAFVNTLKDPQYIFQDSGKISFQKDGVQTERYFANIASIGFAGIVTKKANLSLKGGKISYILALLKSLRAYRSSRLKITFNDIYIYENIYNVSVCICKYAGGGMKFGPAANPGDGLFDLTVIKDLPAMEVVRNILFLFSGSFIKHPKVNTYRTEKLSIESKENVLIETDGEFIGNLNAEISIVKQALKVTCYNEFNDEG